MELLSDVIFGNGESIPGGEDISVLCDENGFPYYKGGTLKGIFREELFQYFNWTQPEEKKREEMTAVLLGKEDAAGLESERKLIFSDLQLSDAVKYHVLEEIGEKKPGIVLDCFSHLRTFTSISEDGTVERGTLRSCRCVNKGLFFFGEISCAKGDEELVKEIVSFIKWIGTMRNRGFGKVRITIPE
jgi:CRISPR-associated protein Csx10